MYISAPEFFFGSRCHRVSWSWAFPRGACSVCRESLAFSKIPGLYFNCLNSGKDGRFSCRACSSLSASPPCLILLAGPARPLFAGTDFPIPPGRASWPYAMVVGPDGNMWFVEWGGQKVGFITTSGVITEYPIPNAQALIGIAKGPDGNLWFTDTMAGTIGRISTSGTNIVHYSLPAGSYPQGITSRPGRQPVVRGAEGVRRLRYRQNHHRGQGHFLFDEGNSGHLPGLRRRLTLQLWRHDCRPGRQPVVRESAERAPLSSRQDNDRGSGHLLSHFRFAHQSDRGSRRKSLAH
jgi:streptogramin lyase